MRKQTEQRFEKIVEWNWEGNMTLLFISIFVFLATILASIANQSLIILELGGIVSAFIFMLFLFASRASAEVYWRKIR